jgi:hypothetical protein
VAFGDRNYEPDAEQEWRLQSYCEQIRESCAMDMAVDRVSLAG